MSARDEMAKVMLPAIMAYEGIAIESLEPEERDDWIGWLGKPADALLEAGYAKESCCCGVCGL